MAYRPSPFTGYRRAPYAGMFHDGAAVGLPHAWVILGGAYHNPRSPAIEVCDEPPGPVLPRYTEWRGLPAMSAPPAVAGYALALRWRDIHARRALRAHPWEYRLTCKPGPAPRSGPTPNAPPNRWPNGAPAR